MATERFLASAWASVHGPADPRAFWIWVLERGFRGVTAAPVPRAVDWRALRAAMVDLPVRVAAVRASAALEGPNARDGSLASNSASDRAAARARIDDAVALAQRLGCRRLILDVGPVRVPGEPGPEDLGDPRVGWTPDLARAQVARRNVRRDAALDTVCRGLFDILRTTPDVEFCFTQSRHVLDLGDPDSLAAIFEDLGRAPIRYWHDAPLAWRRQELFGVAQGEWLERFANRMAGMTLGDAAGGALYLSPGFGGVDYPLLGAYRRRTGRPIPAVVELDLAVDPGEIPGVHAFLDKHGL